MKRPTVLFMISIIFQMLLIPQFLTAQEKVNYTLTAKLTGEHRDNITRAPDSSRRSDFRSNLFLFGEYRKKLKNEARWNLSYELQYHRYNSERDFDRHDHLIRGAFSIPLFKSIKFNLSDEFRLRFHPSLDALNYLRNIGDISLRFPFFLKQQMAFGFQSWNKTYPNTRQFRDFVSNRYYLSLNRRLASNMSMSIKGAFQEHRGTLFPGSTAPDQLLNQESARWVFNFSLDKIFSRKLLAGLAYRYENDEPDIFDSDDIGRHISDEDAIELLADDADFGYRKHQLSLSTLIKINTRVSLITFYLMQLKDFKYWEVSEDGPLREDDLIFLSTQLKISIHKKSGIQLQYNFESNDTDVGLYHYQLNSVSFGFYWNN